MSSITDRSKDDDFLRHVSEGKLLAAEGRLKESLQKFELAKKIWPAPKVLKRIEKLKECLNAIEEQKKGDSNCVSSSQVNSSLNSRENNGITSCQISNCDQNKIGMPNVLNDIQNVQVSSHKVSKSSDLSPKSQSKFREYKKEAKELSYEGKYEEALVLFEKALSICDCPNVKRYMQQVQSVLSEHYKNMASAENSSLKKRKEKSSNSEPITVQKESSSELSSKYEKIPKPYDAYDNMNLSKQVAPNLEQASPQNTTMKMPQKHVLRSSSGQAHKEIHLHNSDKSSGSPDFDTKYNKDAGSASEETDLEEKIRLSKALYCEARDLAADGKLNAALKVLKKAQALNKTEKVEKKIKKIEEILSIDLNNDENDQMVKIADDFSVFHDIYDKLYPYQREGVAWMWKLFKMGKGGVLGDDMGLGKTFQVIAFLSGMIDADLAKHVLIIMPVSLIQNWSREFKKWCPGIAVHDYHSGTKKERERNLLRAQKRGHVLLTSYGMVVNNVDALITLEGREFVWDYLILDEGHKIKNPTKTTKAVYEIPSKNRLVLTGTPIQNNLRELWSLYDFAHQGTLLGSVKTFKMQYETPITRAREKDATAGEKRLGTEMAGSLKSLIQPYFLRRTKDEIWKKEEDDVEDLGGQMEKMTISKLQARKNDLILWTFMSDPQIEIYNSFLHSDAVKSILVSKRSPLVELTTLKKICDHPRLLSQRACVQLGLNGEIPNEDLIRELDDESTMASSIDNVSDETLLIESGKLKLVIQLLENLKETGHRTLIFSLSRKILDMIHRILVNKQWKVMRLDGTISKTEERERRIQKFQNDSSYPVFLLTTQVGGVGITLTAADRVIIYDPSWNPATDAQAVDRVYRIGQQKDVIVYRLITCGSVEEKIYRRQIFKDSITRQATGAADPYRYFSKQELRELFSLDNPHYSATQVQLSEMHASHRNTCDDLEKHLVFLRQLSIFGISDHDLMFTKNIQDHSEDNDNGAVSENFIKKQVAAAQELIKMEASVVADGIRLAGTYNRPYQETIPLPNKNVVKDTYKPPVLPEVIDLTENAAFPSPKSSPQYRKQGRFEDLTENAALPSPKSLPKHGEQEINPQLPQSQRKIRDYFLSNKQTKENYLSPLEKKALDFEVIKFTEPRLSNRLDTSYNIEKMRKSLNSHETSVTEQDEEVPELMDEEEKSNVMCEKNNSKSFHVEETDKAQGDGQSFCEDQNASVELSPVKSSPKYEGQLENLSPLLHKDLVDLDFEPEFCDKYVRSSRVSCARRTTLIISDSDTSHSAESNMNDTDNLVEDSEDASNCDSSNSANVSFVPDSTPNTPQTVKLPKGNQTIVSETPPSIFRFTPKSVMQLGGVISHADDITLISKKLEGSVGGITPLKVEKALTPENSSFAQAMATSRILTPYNSPEQNKSTHISPPATEHLVHQTSFGRSESLDSESDHDDSPIKFTKKKKPQLLGSDTEESDEEQENIEDLKLSSSERNKIHRDSKQLGDSEHSSLFETEDEIYTDASDGDEEDSICSSEGRTEKNHPSDETLDSSDDDKTSAVSHKVRVEKNQSIEETSDASENENHDTSNASEEEDESGSEYSESSGEEEGHSYSEESSNSDESGSLFN